VVFRNKQNKKGVIMKKTVCKIGDMFKKLDELFNEFVKLIGEKEFDDHWTGVLVVKCIDDQNTIRTKRMISADNPKAEKYGILAPEKANRLHSFILSGHLTSYESRNPKSDVFVARGRNEKWGHWGGAVLISKDFIFSFSGLPELLDEAFVCFLGLKSGLMSREQFNKIKKRRENNKYLKLL
jgi:hypothetical protein